MLDGRILGRRSGTGSRDSLRPSRGRAAPTSSISKGIPRFIAGVFEVVLDLRTVGRLGLGMGIICAGGLGFWVCGGGGGGIR